MSTMPGDDETEPVGILLVDDRPSNLNALEAILHRSDYNLVLARSGPEALALVLRHEFAVILLDVAMPGMDGFELAAAIKDRDQSKLIPIIFVTASVYEMEHIFRGYTVGAVDYMLKPIDPHQVRAKVAVFVELFLQRKHIEVQATRLRELEIGAQRQLRERAEQALRESEAVYQLTFEQAPIGIGHATPDGRWIRANLRLCEILGCSRDELVGQPVARIAERADAGALAEALSRLQSGDATSYTHEHRLATPRAGESWGAVSLSVLRDNDRVARLIVVIDDVTARRQAEAERVGLIRKLERSIQVKDEFLAIAAHELRTPITPLRLQTASLLRAGSKHLAGNGLLRRLEAIDSAAARLETLIDQLLDVFRLSGGDLALQLEDVDLREVVKGAVARFAQHSPQYGSEISIDVPERIEGLVGRWDRLRLEQVVANLLSNAIKYGNGAPIEVTVSAGDDHAQLSVGDRGMGIPLAEQARIFERFERLTPVGHHGGFGLGLWLVREIVNAHGGHVTLWSRPGEGSRFTVELPREPFRDRTGPEDRWHGEAHP